MASINYVISCSIIGSLKLLLDAVIFHKFSKYVITAIVGEQLIW